MASSPTTVIRIVAANKAPTSDISASLVTSYNADVEASALALQQSWNDARSRDEEAAEKFFHARLDLNFVPRPEQIQTILSMPRTTHATQRAGTLIAKHLLQCGYTYESLRVAGFTLDTLMVGRKIFVLADLIQLGATYNRLVNDGLAAVLVLVPYDDRVRALAHLVRHTVQTLRRPLTLARLRVDRLLSQSDLNDLLSLGPDALRSLQLTMAELVNKERITAKQMSGVKHLYKLADWCSLGFNRQFYNVLEQDRSGVAVAFDWSVEELRANNLYGSS